MSLTIVTAREFEFPTQGWVGVDQPDPARLPSSFESTGPSPKPRNGFFTSTWDEAQRSTAWLDFMAKEGQRAPGRGARLWLLHSAPDARLLVIGSVRDFGLLTSEYPQRWDDRNPTVFPHWRRILEDTRFDAVHITANAVEEGRAQPPTAQPQLSGWDVESTLWLRWCVKLDRSVGEVSDDWVLQE